MSNNQAVTKTDDNSIPPSVVPEDDLTSSKSVAQPCQDAGFVTAIYVFGQRTFWLLPEKLLGKVETSADRLKAAVSKATAEERIKALEATGLRDLFLPPTAHSFLPPDQQQEWQTLNSEIGKARSELKELRQEFDSFIEEHRERGKQIDALTDEDERTTKSLEARTQLEETIGAFERNIKECFDIIKSGKSRLEDLEDEGFSAAENAGYLLEQGELFLPEKKGIMALIKTYQEVREDFEEDEFDNQQDLEAFVSQLRRNEEQLEYEFSQPTVNWAKLEPFWDAAAKLTGKMQDYLLSVEDLAHAGFATPEYALSASKDSLQKGVLALSDFKKLQYKKQSLKTQQQERFELWWDSLGGKGPIPSGELEQFQRDINTCEAKQQGVRTSAHSAAGALVPPKLFLWNPAEYEFPSVKALVRPGMPLREFCQLGGKTVRHFSLLDIAGAKDYLGTSEEPDSPFDVAMAIKAAQQPGNDKALDKLLTDMGAKPYPLQESWFDKNGVFQPEHFFEAIENDPVCDLQNEDDKAAWGAYLQNLLFKKSAARRLPRFDDSYSGQFMRLVLSGIGTSRETDGLKVDVLNFDNNSTGPKAEPDADSEAISQQLGKLDLQLKATFWEGRTDLFSLQLPKPEDTKHVEIPYSTKDGDHDLQLGKFYCQLEGQCWGSVGANLMLTRTLEIKATRKGQLEISGVDVKKREALGAEFEASAAAKVGAMVNTELYWSLPEDLKKHESKRQLHGSVPEWLNVGMVEVEGEAVVGAEANYDFRLGLRDGRMVMHLKGKAIAGMGIGGGISCELALDTVPILMRLMQQELHKNGYRYVVWVDKDAFDYMSLIMQIHLSTALSFAFLTGLAYDKLEEMGRNWDRDERAGELALRIAKAIDIENEDDEPTDDEPRVTFQEYQSWFQGLQPEAIGPMLHTLVAEPVAIKGKSGDEDRSELQVLKLQQRSILQCLRWMTAAELVKVESYRAPTPNRIQRQFEEALTRMNTQGVKKSQDDEYSMPWAVGGVSLATPAALALAQNDGKNAAQRNLKRLDDFMARNIIDLDDERMNKAYMTVRRKLSLHLLDLV